MEMLWPHTVTQQATVSSFSRWTPKVRMCSSESQTRGFTTSLHQRHSLAVLSYILDDYDEGSVVELLRRRSWWCLCPAGSFVSQPLWSTIMQIFNHNNDCCCILVFQKDCNWCWRRLWKVFKPHKWSCGGHLSCCFSSRHLRFHLFWSFSPSNGSFSSCFSSPSNTTLIIPSNRSCSSEKWPRATRKQSKCAGF